MMLTQRLPEDYKRREVRGSSYQQRLVADDQLSSRPHLRNTEM